MQHCGMRIAIVDESAARASIIEEGLASHPDCQTSWLKDRAGLIAKLAKFAQLPIAPRSVATRRIDRAGHGVGYHPD